MGKKVLGRGLDGLFGDDALILKKTVASHPSDADEIVSRETIKIKLVDIEPNRSQPRKNFDKDSLEELSESIKQYGILQPVLVRKRDDMYEIVAGERRWRAAQIAGLKEIPVIIKDLAPMEAAEIALIENIQREDLDPIEEANAYSLLIKEYGLRQEDLAKRVAKNRSTVANSLRLLQLTAKVQAFLRDGKLSAGHARALAGVSDPERQEKLAEKIVEEGLNVRETEKLLQKPENIIKKKKEKKEKDIYIKMLEENITECTGTKAKIVPGKKEGGKIEIEYYNAADLENITGRLINR